MMIQLLINGLLACIMLPDAEAFIQCIDDVVLEYNMSLENLEETQEFLDE